MKVSLHQHKSIQDLMNQFKTGTEADEVLYNHDSPMRRTMGFVSLDSMTYHFVALVTVKECSNFILKAPLKAPSSRYAFFGTPPNDPRVGEMDLAIDPPRLTIKRSELRKGLRASGLPKWVQDDLYRDAEKSGMFP